MPSKRPARAPTLPAAIRVSVGDDTLSLSADCPPAQVADVVAFLVGAYEAAHRAHVRLRSEVESVPGDSVHVPDEDGWGYGRKRGIGFR